MNDEEKIFKSLLSSAKVGDKVYFAEEVRGYRVIARNERYLICTKPFNPKKTVLYTIVDSQDLVRGTENYIFCHGAETVEQCEQMLERISSGETQISHRNSIQVFVTCVDHKIKD